MMLRVTGKLGAFDDHPMIEHFKFVEAHTAQTPKMTIPSPSSLHFRYGRDAVPDAIYPDMDEFYRDLGQTYRKAVRAFADAGCRYLQLDEVNFTYLCDPKLRAQVANRGDDPEKLPAIYAGMINAAIVRHSRRHDHHHASVPRQFPLDLRRRRAATSRWRRSCSTAINVHGYFMEYDSERAGGFEPLRFVPKGKTVVLGLVTSKSGTLEIQGRDQAPHRAGGEIRAARPALPVAAMRLRLDRGRQYSGRGRAMGEAAHDRRDRRGGVGMSHRRPRDCGDSAAE